MGDFNAVFDSYDGVIGSQVQDAKMKELGQIDVLSVELIKLWKMIDFQTNGLTMNTKSWILVFFTKTL